MATDFEGNQNIQVDDIITLAGDRYRIIEKIGSGSSGDAYYVWPILKGQPLSQYQCVIKVPKLKYADEALYAIDKIFVEEEAQRLSQHYEAKVYDYTYDNGDKTFITMTPDLGIGPVATPDPSHHGHYCLHPDIEKNDILSSILWLCAQTLYQYAFFHQQGVQHWDCKPENLLINPSHNPPIIPIDFASTATSHITVPPERLKYSDQTAAIKSDFYSEGSLLALFCGGKNVYADKLAVESKYQAAEIPYKFDMMIANLEKKARAINFPPQEIQKIINIIQKMCEQQAANRPENEKTLIMLFYNAAKKCQQLESAQTHLQLGTVQQVKNQTIDDQLDNTTMTQAFVPPVYHCIPYFEYKARSNKPNRFNRAHYLDNIKHQAKKNYERNHHSIAKQTPTSRTYKEDQKVRAQLQKLATIFEDGIENPISQEKPKLSDPNQKSKEHHRVHTYEAFNKICQEQQGDIEAILNDDSRLLQVSDIEQQIKNFHLKVTVMYNSYDDSSNMIKNAINKIYRKIRHSLASIDGYKTAADKYCYYKYLPHDTPDLKHLPPGVHFYVDENYKYQVLVKHPNGLTNRPNLTHYRQLHEIKEIEINMNKHYSHTDSFFVPVTVADKSLKQYIAKYCQSTRQLSRQYCLFPTRQQTIITEAFSKLQEKATQPCQIY